MEYVAPPRPAQPCRLAFGRRTWRPRAGSDPLHAIADFVRGLAALPEGPPMMSLHDLRWSTHSPTSPTL